MFCIRVLVTLMVFSVALLMDRDPAFGFDSRDQTIDELPVGTSEFKVNVPRGPVIVNVYRPRGFTADSPVWIVIHGARRNVANHIAYDYFDVWKPLAERNNALLLIPEFTKRKWPMSWQFQLGNVATPKLRRINKRNQGFAVIQHAFDIATRRTGSLQRKFHLYGHGAGGQWVQRYILHTGGHRVARAVAANPGWYLLPDYEYRFPYGLKGLPIANRMLRRAFSSDFVLLLGQDDVSHGDPLRKNAQTNAQGRNRFQRGHFYFARAQSAASRLGNRFAWRLHEVPGVDHNNRRMAPTAAEFFARSRN